MRRVPFGHSPAHSMTRSAHRGEPPSRDRPTRASPVVARSNAAARGQRRARCDYALELVGPAPLPPHERAWRHPSELAVTAVGPDTPIGGGRALVLATGVAAAMMAAVMVVALTPPRSAAPSAVSATTLPALTVQVRGTAIQGTDRVAVAQEADAVRIDRSTLTRDSALSLVGSPDAVSTAPSNLDALDVATRTPNSADVVYVLDRSHTYALDWSQIDRLGAPDGSVVVNADGELLATFVDGELVLHVR